MRRALATLRAESGQFIPISTMVMLSTIVFLVAIVNVYKIAQAKLKVQNLADATALNVASSMVASSLNVQADRNKWLNHLYAGMPDPNDLPTQNGQDPCADFYGGKMLPPLSCAENNTSNANNHKAEAMRNGYIFFSDDGAKAYAQLVHTINLAQELFQNVYNNFMGAGNQTGSGSSLSGGGSLWQNLQTDIPDLNDPSIHFAVWNNSSGEQTLGQQLSQNSVDSLKGSGPLVGSSMTPLKMTPHNVKVLIWQKTGTWLTGYNPFGHIEEKTLGDLAGEPKGVGWMQFDPNDANQPKISVASASGGTSQQLGVGVMVRKDVSLMGLPPYAVVAKAKAYVVNGSGQVATPNAEHPRFDPKFWVKLAKP